MKEEWINQLLHLFKLTPREQLVITERYFTAHRSTHEQIGLMLNLSRERIRQIETKAIRKISRRLKLLNFNRGINTPQIIFNKPPEPLSPDPHTGVLENVFENQQIEVLNLSTRARNVLDNINVKTVGQLMNLTKSDLMRTRNCGHFTTNEIVKALARFGANLTGEGEG
ncbi:MAG: sigma factor-like helix-turn-helix DNA-binding protein [Pseudomonadota bacterium]